MILRFHKYNILLLLAEMANLLLELVGEAHRLLLEKMAFLSHAVSTFCDYPAQPQYTNLIVSLNLAIVRSTYLHFESPCYDL